MPAKVLNDTNEEIALSNSAKNASFLVLSSIFTKLSTFIMNQMLVRHISPFSIGVASYLELVTNTVIFLSRECGRIATQRTSSHVKEPARDSNESRHYVVKGLINFGFLSLIIGLCLSSIGVFFVYKSRTYVEGMELVNGRSYILLLTWLSIVVELASEPTYMILQYDLDLKKKSLYESTATLIRCVITFLCVMYSVRYDVTNVTHDAHVIFAFALGRIGYAVALWIQYYRYFCNKKAHRSQKYPTKLRISKIQATNRSYYFETEAMGIWKTLILSLVFKEVLTEGDKYVINYLFTVEEQGLYSVVSNYGSLVARLLFQPIEESSRLILSKLHGNNTLKSKLHSYELMNVLGTLYFKLSILLLIGAYPNAPYFLRFLLSGKGSSWSSTVIFDTFKHYIAYIPLLAFNGILEAFFSSIASQSNLRLSTYYMSLSTIIVLTFLYFLKGQHNFGLDGLILANSLNMALRIVFASSFYYAYYKNQLSKSNLIKAAISISKEIVLASALAYLEFLYFGRQFESKTFKDVIVSAIISLVYLLVALYENRAEIIKVVERFKSNKIKSD